MVFVEENQVNVDGRYRQFFQSNYRRMREILPQDMRVVDIVKCMVQAWKDHIEQEGIQIEDILQHVKNQWMRGEIPRRQ